MVPPQLTSRLGFINPGLTLFPMWKSATEKSADVPEAMDSSMAPIQLDFNLPPAHDLQHGKFRDSSDSSCAKRQL